MERASFKDVSQYLKSIKLQSGDAMLTKAFWNVLKLGPTDPGVHTLKEFKIWV